MNVRTNEKAIYSHSHATKTKIGNTTMASSSSTLAFSLTLVLSLLHISTATSATSSDENFIRSSCGATTYPSVCYQSLATYASTIQNSPRQLVTTALSVCVDTAQTTKKHVAQLNKFHGLRPREYAALKDCLVELSDSVDRLSKSAQELKEIDRARGTEYIWHMSNLQTWVSAALTDDSTCMDGFAGPALNGRIKTSIRARITNLAQVTSNALALCNQFAGKY